MYNNKDSQVASLREKWLNAHAHARVLWAKTSQSVTLQMRMCGEEAKQADATALKLWEEYINALEELSFGKSRKP